MNQVTEHFLASYRDAVKHYQDKIDAEAANLSDFRKGEAAALALTNDERERMEAFRLFAAAPRLLGALKLILDPITNTDEALYTHSRDEARAAIDEAEGR